MMNRRVAWIVSDDNPLVCELKNALQEHCDCEAVRQSTTTLRPDSGFESPADAPSWIFVDVRDNCGWDDVSVVHHYRERRLSKPVATIGILDDGFPLDQCVQGRQLLDGHTCAPFCADQLQGLVSRLPAANGARPNRFSHQPKVLQTKSHRFETHTPSMFDLVDNLASIAERNFTILLVGETGTGKSTLARIVHDLSPCRDKPFINVACGALPNELIGSELFGHVRGSFTGADMTTEGKFAAAKDGTILLDEIDVLGVAQQAKLLRVLETGEFEQVGSNETRRVRARVIVATNIELESLIKRNEFRQDLYFRLNQVKFEIPPLRSRPADIVPLTLQFVDECCRSQNLVVRRVHPDFLAALQAHCWPGNIRELRNEVSRAVLFAKHGVLEPRLLAPAILQSAASPGAENANHAGLAAEVACTEQATIEKMLRVHNFNRAATARALGISRVTLYNKIRKYRIRVESLQQQAGL